MSDVLVSDLGKQEDLPQLGHAMEEWPASDILSWAAERFAPRVTFATGFGAEGGVLIDIIGQHMLPIGVFTLDTGLLFPERPCLRTCRRTPKP